MRHTWHGQQRQPSSHGAMHKANDKEHSSSAHADSRAHLLHGHAGGHHRSHLLDDQDNVSKQAPLLTGEQDKRP